MAQFQSSTKITIDIIYISHAIKLINGIINRNAKYRCRFNQKNILTHRIASNFVVQSLYEPEIETYFDFLIYFILLSSRWNGLKDVRLSHTSSFQQFHSENNLNIVRLLIVFILLITKQIMRQSRWVASKGYTFIRTHWFSLKMHKFIYFLIQFDWLNATAANWNEEEKVAKLFFCWIFQILAYCIRLTWFTLSTQMRMHSSRSVQLIKLNETENEIRWKKNHT